MASGEMSLSGATEKGSRCYHALADILKSARLDRDVHEKIESLINDSLELEMFLVCVDKYLPKNVADKHGAISTIKDGLQDLRDHLERTQKENNATENESSIGREPRPPGDEENNQVVDSSRFSKSLKDPLLWGKIKSEPVEQSTVQGSRQASDINVQKKPVAEQICSNNPGRTVSRSEKANEVDRKRPSSQDFAQPTPPPFKIDVGTPKSKRVNSPAPSRAQTSALSNNQCHCKTTGGRDVVKVVSSLENRVSSLRQRLDRLDATFLLKVSDLEESMMQKITEMSSMLETLLPADDKPQDQDSN